MTHLYFATDWIVTTVDSLNYLADTAKELNCGLASIQPIKKSSAGYAVVTLALRVPSETVLDELIAKSSKETGIADWYSTSKEFYETGILFLQETPIQISIKILDGWLYLERANRRLRNAQNTSSDND